MSRPKHPLNHLMFVDGRATREYAAWSGLNHRSGECYKDIFVSDELKDKVSGFKIFIDDVGFAPSNKHDIDRIDNNKGYEVGNLKWSTRSENLANRSVTLRVINYDGTEESLSKFCERTGQNPLRLRQRFRVRKTKTLHVSEFI